MPDQDIQGGGYGFIPYGKGRQDPQQSNAFDAIQAVNQGMLNGQPADLTLADYLGALEQRAGQPYANKVALEIQNVAPQLSRDILSAKSTEGLRKEFRARVELARNGQLPPDLLPGGGAPEAPQQQAPAAQGGVATMQPQGETQQTPASQQLNSNTPGEARGAAADVGQRSPQSMAAQAPGSGVTPSNGQTQGSLPPTPAIATYQQGLQTQQAEGRAKQAQAGVQATQAGNQQQILGLIEQVQAAGLPIPPEWRALAEGRPVSPEVTSADLAENQTQRGFEGGQRQLDREARASEGALDRNAKQREGSLTRRDLAKLQGQNADLKSSAREARQKVARLQKAKELYAKVNTGPIAGRLVPGAAKSKDRQQLDALVEGLRITAASNRQGSVSNYERSLFGKALPGAESDAATEIYDQMIAEYQQAIADDESLMDQNDELMGRELQADEPQSVQPPAATEKPQITPEQARAELARRRGASAR